MQVLYLGRAPRTKETLPNFLKWRRVTRPPLVFRGLTGSQWTLGVWGVTATIAQASANGNQGGSSNLQRFEAYDPPPLKEGGHPMVVGHCL